MVQEVQYQEAKRTHELQDFIVELIVQGKAVRVPAKCYNQESASHTALAMVAISYPQVSGYNLLSADGLTLIEEVHPTQLFNHASPIIQQITGQQPLKMAVPIVKTVDPGQWEKMLADANEKKKVIQ
jgi:hypothetical protein